MGRVLGIRTDEELRNLLAAYTKEVKRRSLIPLTVKKSTVARHVLKDALAEKMAALDGDAESQKRD